MKASARRLIRGRMRLKGLNTTGLQKVDDPSLPEPSGWLSDEFDEYSLCQNVACSASVQPVLHFQAFDPAEVFGVVGHSDGA
jgi:hypothetical protein